MTGGVGIGGSLAPMAPGDVQDGSLMRGRLKEMRHGLSPACVTATPPRHGLMGFAGRRLIRSPPGLGCRLQFDLELTGS
jgi:hypothetical protein